jgi:hypothetical protein
LLNFFLFKIQEKFASVIFKVFNFNFIKKFALIKKNKLKIISQHPQKITNPIEFTSCIHKSREAFERSFTRLNFLLRQSRRQQQVKHWISRKKNTFLRFSCTRYFFSLSTTAMKEKIWWIFHVLETGVSVLCLSFRK